MILLLSFLFYKTVNAQKHPVKIAKNKTSSIQKIQNLKIGDPMPDILIPMIINDRYSSVRSTNFKNQLLIVDFWFTNCGACVAGLPKMMSLQQEFGDRIKVLPVTFEKKEVVGKFLKTNFKTRDIVVPTVIEDKVLSQLFKHVAAPHQVWIYHGNVIAITEQDYVNSKNINFILNGGKNDWPVKNDYLPAVDIKTPLVRQDMSRFTGVNPLKRYAAIFGCYQDGVITKMGMTVDSVNGTCRNYIINLPILNIYSIQWSIASGINRFPEPSGIILEVKDPSKFVSLEDSEETSFVRRQKTYICYESMGPNTLQTREEAALEIIKDFDNLLGLKGRYEKRKMNCLILIEKDSIDAIKSRTENGEGKEFLAAPNIKIQNKSLDGIVWKMNQVYGNPPAFNETSYKGNVNMKFSLNSWKNIPELRIALQGFGLDLKEEQRELEVFVLTENHTNQQLKK